MAEGAKAAGASRIIGIDIDSKKFDVGIASPSISTWYPMSYSSNSSDALQRL